MHTVETVLGRESLTLEEYEEALASAGPADMKSLEQLAAQLASEFPDEAARVMVGILLRDDLWEALGSSTEGWPLFLNFADAQDHALKALASCSQGADQVALELLVRMRGAVESKIVDRVWRNLYAASGTLPTRVQVAVSRELESLDLYDRIEQPLIDLHVVIKRAVMAVGFRSEQADRMLVELSGLTRGLDGFEERFVEPAVGATVLNPHERLPGARFLVGLLAVAYRKREGPIPSEGFWRDERLFCRGRTGGKKFFYETIDPSRTAGLMSRVLDPPGFPAWMPDDDRESLASITRGENFQNLVYTCRTMPAAIPHLLNVLQTPQRKERGYFLDIFRHNASNWEPLTDALVRLVSEVERLLEELGPSPLESSDERPLLWELAGALEVLADVADAAAKRSDHDVNVRAVTKRLRDTGRELRERWPTSPPSGWNPYTSIRDRKYRYHPADLIDRAAAQLSCG